ITTTIANDVVTYAKLQNVAANSFLVNPTTSSADVQELVAGNSQLAGRGSTGNIAMITMGAGVQVSGTQLQAVDQTATNELQTVDTFN
ncbi:hypothetical protein, partial [Pseudomonas glycinae]|uniref:hypothetical protein n=1 Tax=Pseudomonas glycinae TaxID=1785145 RepID=UPI002B1DE5CC